MWKCLLYMSFSLWKLDIKYFHQLSNPNSESPLTCRSSLICKPIHHEGELLDDKALSRCSLCVHLQIEYTNGPHVPLAKVICANVKSDKWVMWCLWEKAVNFYNVLNRSERASRQAGREGGIEDWSGAAKVGCHAGVLCCRQGTSVTHSLSSCFTSLLAPRLYFLQISSHQPP